MANPSNIEAIVERVNPLMKADVLPVYTYNESAGVSVLAFNSAEEPNITAIALQVTSSGSVKYSLNTPVASALFNKELPGTGGTAGFGGQEYIDTTLINVTKLYLMGDGAWSCTVTKYSKPGFRKYNAPLTVGA